MSGPHLAAEVAFLMTAIEHSNRQFASVEALQEHIMENYLPVSSCTDCRAILANTKQTKNESTTKFAARIRMLWEEYRGTKRI